VFEIGNSLHEARVRQGLDLQTAELATKVRAKYLKALEEEQFELLPAQTYVKGFLRTYADFLGLDGQLYVDEYNSRFVAGEEDGRPRRSSVRPPPRSRRIQGNVVLVTLASIAIVAALVIVAWKNGEPNETVEPQTTTVAKPSPKAKKKAPVKSVHLVVTAKRGNTLLEVHSGSELGRLLFQGTLLRGKSVSFWGKRIWLDVADPANLAARVNGQRYSKLGKLHRPARVVVTARGVFGTAAISG
jgi:cytoskeleton protein RodZ